MMWRRPILILKRQGIARPSPTRSTALVQAPGVVLLGVLGRDLGLGILGVVQLMLHRV